MDAVSASTEPELTGSIPPRRPYNGALRRERAAETRRADHHCRSGAAPRVIHPELAGLDHPGRRGAGGRQRADRLPLLRQRARAARRGDPPARGGGRDRPGGDATRRHRRHRGTDLRARVLLSPRTAAAPRPDPRRSEPTPARRGPLGAVAARTGRWSPEDREVVAAMFDVLWSVASYERLVADWRIDSERAIRGITWVIELVEEAVRSGRGPCDGPRWLRIRGRTRTRTTWRSSAP